MVIAFLLTFGTIGRRRRSRTRYFMIKAKLYDDRLYGRDLPMVALSNFQNRNDVSEVARTLSGDATITPMSTLSGDGNQEMQHQLSREEYKQWTQEISKCEELPSEAGVTHALCGCYPTDLAAHHRRSEGSKLPTKFIEEDNEANDVSRDNECKLMYKYFISKLCCGRLLNRWVQCLGVCALAQEARETKLLVPKLAQRVDYITHQPWYEYETQVKALRQSNNSSFRAHLNVISKLSKHILLCSLCSVILTVLTVYLTVENFGWGNASVLFCTFGISFFIIYIVQWRNHRFTLSLDAVIKLFAAGFVLAVPTAYIIEGMLQVLILCVSIVIYLMLSIMNLQSILERHAYVIAIVGEIINAFIIAAVTEELTKYFVYRCVEHPDLMLADDYIDENEEIITSDGVNHKLSIAKDERTNEIRATSITIAMVTVAVGLACAENVVYVYLAGGTQVQEELIVLLARSIFPVHALCAAIQSIGVVLRDIEARPEYHLGKITLPAIWLHGGFDAILMIMGVLEEEGDNDFTYVADSIAWCSIFIVLGSAIGWYLRESRAQLDRLRQLDDLERQMKLDISMGHDSNSYTPNEIC